MPGSRLPGGRFGEQTGGAADKGGENQQTNAHDRDLWIRVHSNDRSLGGLTQGSETEKCGSKMGRRSLTPSPTSTAWLQLARKAV